MSTIKSSTEHLTLNADGTGKEIKFQANGVEKASISSAGAFTSTTIDATALTGNLPAIDGSALTNLPVLQVVHKRCSANLNTTSSSFVTAGDTLSITPSSTSSKILIMATSHLYVTGGAGSQWTAAPTAVFRGSTQISENQDYGVAVYKSASADRMMAYSHLQELDSPNTTSSVTYDIRYKNRNGYSTLVNQYGVGSITLMEIGA